MAPCESTWTKRCSISASLRSRRRVGVAARLARVGGGELAGRALERGREEERLALARRLGDDPADGRLEAHVEHPVGLVEDEDADALQRDRAARDQVLEPARRGDDDVGAVGGLDLGAEADAAVDGGDLQVARAGDRVELVDDLAGQLAGRRQDQGGEALAPGSIRSTSGMPKASVLPDPVGDWTSRSWPASASRMTSCWTGKGWVMSRSASARTTALEMPRSANDTML